jgi:hypothetical protein
MVYLPNKPDAVNRAMTPLFRILHLWCMALIWNVRQGKEE